MVGLAIFSAMFVTGLIVLSIRLIVFRMKRSVEKPYRLQKPLRKQIDIPDVYRGPSESKLSLGTEKREGKGKREREWCICLKLVEPVSKTPCVF